MYKFTKPVIPIILLPLFAPFFLLHLYPEKNFIHYITIIMKIRFHLLLTALISLMGLFVSCHSKPEKASLTIYCTTDVHGTIFDYDLKRDRPNKSSLANVSAIISAERASNPDIILLDNGDILQGQPSNYYYNVIDTTETNITAQVMNYLQYDAGSIGNHDIEAGHPVYDKMKRELQHPWLSANAVSTTTGEPYFQPYTIINRNGIKIAVLGMTTPGIPKWLPKHLWEGIEFKDMIETARLWVPRIQATEKPDLLIGLFHAGFDYEYGGENENTPLNENASMLVARKVDGFDLIIMGHDHQGKVDEITNDAGHKVVVIDPRSHATFLGKIDIELTRKGNQYDKNIQAHLIKLAGTPKDTAYIRHFTPALNKVKTYIDTEIGTFSETLSGRDGIFGPSAFTDFIHNVQLATTGADISFSTVLQMDARIEKGAVTIRDMFNLYSYENGLYTMAFTGQEIDRYLEFAYGLQYNTMRSGKDHLLNFQTDDKGQPVENSRGSYTLAHPFFNFSCAAGIRYTVDVSKEPGQRVEIQSLSDGSPFDENKTYKVAINSYRGNGGGGHLSQGLGWSKEEMEKRILEIKPKDVRYYITEYIRKQKTLDPQCRNDWKVIPEKWFKQGKEKDYKLIYETH